MEYGAAVEMACNASHELVGIFVLEGAAEIALRDGLVEQLGTYQFALITPGQSYRVNIANAPCTIGRVAYQSNLERARLLFKLLPSVLFIRELKQKEVNWQFDLARLIAQQRDSTAPGSAAINRRLVEAALIGTIQQYLTRNDGLRRQVTDSLLARVGPSLHAIHHFPDKKWTVASLASVAGMSRTLFATMFVESTGATPARYLTRLRMERARDLLQRSQLSLAMVAHHMGYGTDVAFARAFQRQFGRAEEHTSELQSLMR